ncbi:MAG: response regulator transcription factor [Lachnospiraceae bacterium]|nr:response regulator transcription factor [Lachnospiraceae bacterium]
MQHIYIVEDDSNIFEIESYALKNSGYQVTGFYSAKEFYRGLSERTPDLVLLDLMLPDEDGLTILKKLRMRGDTKNVPIILVTAKSTEIDKVKGLDTGADDYITKPFGIMELISRVKALLRRSEKLPEKKFFAVGDIFMDGEKHMVYVNDKPVELTFKEYELLKYLIINQGVVVSRDMIMERVWATGYEGETRTVDVHIKSLRQKLKESGKLIKTVRNVGYILEAEE